jgi:hypothetical protein
MDNKVKNIMVDHNNDCIDLDNVYFISNVKVDHTMVSIDFISNSGVESSIDCIFDDLSGDSDIIISKLKTIHKSICDRWFYGNTDGKIFIPFNIISLAKNTEETIDKENN